MVHETKFSVGKRKLSEKQKAHVQKQKKFLSTLFGEPKKTLFAQYEAETKSLIILRYERQTKSRR